MSCEQLSEQLPDYWAGRLTGEARRAFEAHLATCADCRAEADALTATWEALGALAEEDVRSESPAALPSPALRGRFDAMLRDWNAAEHAGVGGAAAARGGARVPGDVVVMPAREAREARAARVVRRSAWRRVVRPALQIAAALLCIAGGFAAGRGWPGAPARTEIADLREELRDMRQMMTLTLLQQQSASERLRGVSWSAQVDRPAAPVLDALLDTLAHDPNVNVRLASIEALTTFAQDARVRTGLVDALAPSRQDSPLVQLALIDALVQMKEQRSVTALKTLAADEHANVSVRRRASWGADALGRS
jgi:anti-sigma factor RsiW